MRIALPFLCGTLLALAIFTAQAHETGAASATIITSEKPSFREALAAREIWRYVYLRTGELLPIKPCAAGHLPATGDLIVVGPSGSDLIRASAAGTTAEKACAELQSDSYLLESIARGEQKILLIAGGDELGTLYGAYEFAETLGVRFYLQQDVIPDEPIRLNLSGIHLSKHPILATRGLTDSNGDVWSKDGPDEYAAIVTQLAKQRMNLVRTTEPFWWGLPEDVNDDGSVKWACDPGNGITDAWQGGKVAFGSNTLLSCIRRSSEVEPLADRERTTLKQDDWIQFYQRVATHCRNAHLLARELGVKTALLCWNPMDWDYPPKEFVARLSEKTGKNLQEASETVYAARIKWIQKNFPLDYLCFAPMDDVCQGPLDVRTPAKIQSLIDQYLSALKAIEQQGAPYKTFVWYDFHDQKNAWVYDNRLPKDIPILYGGTLATYSRYPMDEGASCAGVTGRPKWVEPLQRDWNSFHSVHLWVGRTRCMIHDGMKQGCTGAAAMVMKPREDELGVNALARAGWDQSGFKRTVIDGMAFGNSWRNDAHIDGTQDPELYQAGAAGFWYRVALPNGTYSATFHFCEFDPSAKAGDRVFDLNLGVQADPIKRPHFTAIPALDIVQKTGGANRALQMTVENISVTDGCLNIEGSAKPGSRLGAILCAVELRKDGYTRKIRLGGKAYKDFSGDIRCRSWLDAACSMTMSSGDFYEDWARSSFGPEAAGEIAEIFSSVDSALPELIECGDMMGIAPETMPWSDVALEYEFLNRLEGLRQKVSGKGNLERYDWWLNNFRYMRAVARASAKWFEFKQAMAVVNAQTEPAARASMAKEKALPIYKEIVASAQEAITRKIETVATRGMAPSVHGLNWCFGVDEKVFGAGGGCVGATRRELQGVLGSDPSLATLPDRYEGTPRLIVPTVRDNRFADEKFSVGVWCVDNDPPAEIAGYWRAMGSGPYQKIALRQVGKGEYSFDFSAEMQQAAAIEYYIQMKDANGQRQVWPVTAPERGQTVIVLPELDQKSFLTNAPARK